MDIGKLTTEELLAEDTFLHIFEIDDPVSRERLALDLADRSRELGVKVKFDKLYSAYEQDMRRRTRELAASQSTKPERQDMDNETVFATDKYLPLKCGNWFATDNGVRTFNNLGEVLACYHPIRPVEVLANLQTGEEKIKIAFRKGGHWREIVVDKDVVASRTKIVGLSNLGVSVTSETAGALVSFLSDVENRNVTDIPVRASSTKLGWVGDDFVPYCRDVIFDGDLKFRDIINDLRESGSYEKWLEFVRSIRKTGRIEPRVMLAASFASPIVSMCDALPFFIHLYGATEGGKTLCLMLAASIWGNPALNSNFIGNVEATPVGFEIRADMLNNLPFMLDDLAQLTKKYDDDFDGLIYMLANGKGKGRGNRSLGLSRSTSWACTFLTTGEHPIIHGQSQAGAANRVVEVETGYSAIFLDGPGTAATLNKHFGHAGRRWVDAISKMDKAEIVRIKQGFYDQLQAMDKLSKQSISLSVLLAADKLATDIIFQDGIYLDPVELAEFLKSEQDVSEDQRCYDYIMSAVAQNVGKFIKSDYGTYAGECWGSFAEKDNERGARGDYVQIIRNAFDRLCRDAGTSSAGFLKWADRNGLLLTTKTDKGRLTRKVRIDGKLANCVCLKMLDDADAYGEKEEDDDLPFKKSSHVPVVPSSQ